MQNGLLLYGRGRYIALNLSAGQVSGFTAVNRLAYAGFSVVSRLSGAIAATVRLAGTISVSSDTGTVTVVGRLDGTFSAKPD